MHPLIHYEVPIPLLVNRISRKSLIKVSPLNSEASVIVDHMYLKIGNEDVNGVKHRVGDREVVIKIELIITQIVFKRRHTPS